MADICEISTRQAVKSRLPHRLHTGDPVTPDAPTGLASGYHLPSETQAHEKQYCHEYLTGFTPGQLGRVLLPSDKVTSDASTRQTSGRQLPYSTPTGYASGAPVAVSEICAVAVTAASHHKACRRMRTTVRKRHLSGCGNCLQMPRSRWPTDRGKGASRSTKVKTAEHSGPPILKEQRDKIGYRSRCHNFQGE
ncbi:hypothetical protein J6590_000566 [Homalodisca vitripennis]|nr:hypothetical protein J6590_000566 [Homalodisca vitripennis]